MTNTNIKLIVGLGNPGAEYEMTRHNVGFWFADQISSKYSGSFTKETRFNAELSRVFINKKDIRILKPLTFMNKSGQSVGEICRYFKIEPEEILVVHDELDLPPGIAKLKRGGGHGGHNGLRDIIAHLASKNFLRLRLGIGHPGNSAKVTGHVLSAPGKHEHNEIENSLDKSIIAFEELLKTDLQKAMHQLHSNNS